MELKFLFLKFVNIIPAIKPNTTKLKGINLSLIINTTLSLIKPPIINPLKIEHSPNTVKGIFTCQLSPPYTILVGKPVLFPTAAKFVIFTLYAVVNPTPNKKKSPEKVHE